MDSNAAQFARKGNPWVSEADRAAMPEVRISRKIRGKFPKNRPEISEPIPHIRGRKNSPALADLQERRKFLQDFTAALGGSRTVAPAPFTVKSQLPPGLRTVNPPADRELTRERLDARWEATVAEARHIREVAMTKKFDAFAAAMADALGE